LEKQWGASVSKENMFMTICSVIVLYSTLMRAHKFMAELTAKEVEEHYLALAPTFNSFLFTE
jgi:hypothetical protein